MLKPHCVVLAVTQMLYEPNAFAQTIEGEVTKRIARDGTAYSFDAFKTYYGQFAALRWVTAERLVPGVNDYLHPVVSPGFAPPPGLEHMVSERSIAHIVQAKPIPSISKL